MKLRTFDLGWLGETANPSLHWLRMRGEVSPCPLH